ncbi:Contactin-5 [Microtus ochrogaster]|uniref:Contactin-5 n=1 Tax=Microtus ochrogaster TaxID=79684 RepID=A0A8J6GBY9_MICOH|nr:Contactin-5 [Microtus ochrogaster]
MKVNSYIPSKSRLRKSQAVLEIPNLQLDDAGVYECTAENSRGKNSFRGQLQIYTYPHWIQKLNDTQLDSGSPLQWECKATGKPRPTYRWLKNGAPLLPQSRVDTANGILMIHSVNQSDAGMYQCLAENKYGAIYASAELKILASPPSFELNQVKKTIIVTKDREVLIECQPQGAPKPTISWRKGDKVVRGNKRLRDYCERGVEILQEADVREDQSQCLLATASQLYLDSEKQRSGCDQITLHIE